MTCDRCGFGPLEYRFPLVLAYRLRGLYLARRQVWIHRSIVILDVVGYCSDKL